MKTHRIAKHEVICSGQTYIYEPFNMPTLILKRHAVDLPHDIHTFLDLFADFRDIILINSNKNGLYR